MSRGEKGGVREGLLSLFFVLIGKEAKVRHELHDIITQPCIPEIGGKYTGINKNPEAETKPQSLQRHQQ